MDLSILGLTREPTRSASLVFSAEAIRTSGDDTLQADHLAYLVTPQSPGIAVLLTERPSQTDIVYPSASPLTQAHIRCRQSDA
jgi:hypothetical protein